MSSSVVESLPKARPEVAPVAKTSSGPTLNPSRVSLYAAAKPTWTCEPAVLPSVKRKSPSVASGRYNYPADADQRKERSSPLRITRGMTRTPVSLTC